MSAAPLPAGPYRLCLMDPPWAFRTFNGKNRTPTRMSMGYYSRKQKEDCLLFTRGRGLPVLAHDVRQVIVAPSEGHSRKPAEQYMRLERLFGDVSRIEMFARNTAPGWDAWGNEVGKYPEALSC